MSIMSQEAKKQLGCVLHWSGGPSSSNAPKQIAPYGDVKQILPFPGAGIGMFDGTGDYLSYPVPTNENLWNGNFTIEGYVYFSNLTATKVLFNQYLNASNIFNFYWNTTNLLLISMQIGDSTVFEYQCAFTPTANTWYYIAAVRSGSTCYLLVNGISQTVTTNTAWGTITAIGGEYRVGMGGETAYAGNISEVRISNVARYTTNFTPPKRQLESDSNTKLLLHFNRNDTTFIDSSPSAHTITAYGDAKQLCSPCGSGVAVFDGYGDYLDISSDVLTGTGDFTAECRIKTINRIGKHICIISNGGTAVTNNQFALKIFDTVARVSFGGYISGKWYSFTSSVNVYDGNWHHIAALRVGTTISIYVDGTFAVSGTIPAGINFGTGYTTTICATKDITEYANCYLSELRISNTARYTTNFTPSTQPFVPDSYTKLLLHMDGTGNAFYDSSDPPGDNRFPILPDGVTITPNGTFAVEKMKDGRNVWKFDGSTNYITISDYASWSMFLNDFTIAGWVKFDSIAANKVIIGQYTDANNQWYLQWTTDNIIQLYGITSSTARFDFSCPLAAVANTWYHIVVQRSGSSCIMYINGGAQTVTQTTAFSATATDIAAVLSIGKIDTGYQAGNVKDLQIFTKALTMDQIAAIMAETYIY